MGSLPDFVPIPRWLVKGKKLKLSDGTLIIFDGKKDNLIIATEEGSKTHVTFVIKADQYGLHTTTRAKNVEYKKDLFKVDSSVLADLSVHWMKKKPQFVKVIREQFWFEHDEVVLDADSQHMSKIRRFDMYDVDPIDLIEYGWNQSQVLKMNFRVGFRYDHFGRCVGMIIPFKKKNRLILANRELLEKIINTAIGLDWLKESLEKEFKRDNEK